MRIGGKFAWAGGAVTALLLGGTFYFSNVLLYPGPPRCTDNHYVFCKDPAQFGLAFQDVEFQTSDNVTIRGWYVPGRPDAPGVLLVHGRGATRYEGMRYLPSLHARGFSVLLIDLRNCGQSQKTFNSMGYHERKDVHGAIDYLLVTKKLPAAGAFGFSMGGAATILAAAEDSRIRAVVVEGAFADVDNVIAEGAMRDFHMPRFPLLPVVEVLYAWRGNLSISELRPVDKIALISPRPVFVIHPFDDDTVPYHHGLELFQAAKEPKQMWSVENPGKLPRTHTRAWQLDKARAEKEIPDFFERSLR
ncbi:MAG: alpha/beta fold hydrolase [Spirochaetia bacterium]|nr:alpha/beta fold hydrolase [Spirochaetia bacterium]